MTAHPARIVTAARREWHIPLPALARLTLWVLVLLAVGFAVVGTVALAQAPPGVVMAPDRLSPSPQPAGI